MQSPEESDPPRESAPHAPTPAGERPRFAQTLLPEVYDELRRIAARRIERLRPGESLQATSLVHEAYLRLVGPDGAAPGEARRAWSSREHFIAAASLAMRHIIVDHARRKAAEKRGGDRLRVTLGAEPAANSERDVDVLEIENALQRLEQRDPVKAQIVTLRFFGGLSVEQTAAALSISTASVKRKWSYARAWLHWAMSGDSDGAAPEPEP